MRILVLHGPNLTLLGERFERLNTELAAQAKTLGHELQIFSANSEGALIDELHRRKDWLEAVIVNPTSLAPIAYALAEALERIGHRAIEVQLVEGRTSVLHDAVEAQCHGENAYIDALEVLSGTREAEKDEPDAAPAFSRLGKSIGRKASPPEPAKVTHGSARKTIGKSLALAAAPKPTGSTLTRATVKAKVSERLAGKLSAESLASWARAEWQSLISGAAVEPGQKDVLEDVLLTLASSAKASDHVILSAIAKLDR